MWSRRRPKPACCRSARNSRITTACAIPPKATRRCASPFCCRSPVLRPKPVRWPTRWKRRPNWRCSNPAMATSSSCRATTAAPPRPAARAASAAINDGAEIILGPLFAQAVTAVAPIARAQGVPVIAFSSDRAVGGDGVSLLSFQPEDEVARIVSYAARHGHSNFAALVPANAYGGKVEAAFRASVEDQHGQVVDVERFEPKPDTVAAPAHAVEAANPDALLIAQGGPGRKAMAPPLAPTPSVKLLGTSLWDDSSIQNETLLAGGWFAAPSQEQWRGFAERYSTTYGARPPRIASLAYDAMSLVALLAKGTPYQRYTDAALTDPNGFSGIDGIFRFRNDGAIERGLAVMEVAPEGF